LITVALDQPSETCIGIDESTAILVEGRQARVVGDYQVIVLHNPDQSRKSQNGLLGGRSLKLDVLLPGDVFGLD
ncbi:MAG: hypothetical protein KDC75_27170, partial [Phaeodactylibacter sp.]|nr:hypothetical protein [Phaeodactylibacter sp.]